MNLILLFPDDFASDGTVRLTGRRARHVHEVHRARVGDSLTVGRVNGQVGKGTVLLVEPDEVRLSVCLSEEPPPPTGLDLLLAMPRPKVLRRVLQSAASLGARRIVLLGAQRVEKSYFDTPFLEPGELERNLVLGLEQACDTILPEVVGAPALPALRRGRARGLLASCDLRSAAGPPRGHARPGGLRPRESPAPRRCSPSAPRAGGFRSSSSSSRHTASAPSAWAPGSSGWRRRSPSPSGRSSSRGRGPPEEDAISVGSSRNLFPPGAYGKIRGPAASSSRPIPSPAPHSVVLPVRSPCSDPRGRTRPCQCG